MRASSELNGLCGWTSVAPCTGRRSSGAWVASVHGIRSLQGCASFARAKCPDAKFVSFSTANDDCSWFRSCATLSHHPSGYRTADLRSGAHGTSASPLVDAFYRHGCHRSLLDSYRGKRPTNEPALAQGTRNATLHVGAVPAELSRQLAGFLAALSQAARPPADERDGNVHEPTSPPLFAQFLLTVDSPDKNLFGAVLSPLGHICLGASLFLDPQMTPSQTPDGLRLRLDRLGERLPGNETATASKRGAATTCRAHASPWGDGGCARLAVRSVRRSHSACTVRSCASVPNLQILRLGPKPSDPAPRS